MFFTTCTKNMHRNWTKNRQKRPKPARNALDRAKTHQNMYLCLLFKISHEFELVLPEFIKFNCC
jgi:hypothetical protein